MSEGLVYPRDASFNATGRAQHHRTLKLHFEHPNDRARSACGRIALLNREEGPGLRSDLPDPEGQDPATVPAYRRCRATGCRERWPSRG